MFHEYDQYSILASTKCHMHQSQDNKVEYMFHLIKLLNMAVTARLNSQIDSVKYVLETDIQTKVVPIGIFFSFNNLESRPVVLCQCMRKPRVSQRVHV